jgi:hypothetical protein
VAGDTGRRLLSAQRRHTLAINRFVSPLHHAAVGVLGSYCAAQCLIVISWLRGQDRPGS